jgi:hypothetical protein
MNAYTNVLQEVDDVEELAAATTKKLELLKQKAEIRR